METDSCVICFDPGVPGTDLQPVQDRGYTTVLNYLAIFEPDFSETLIKKKTNNEQIYIHRNCQRRINRQLNKKRKVSDESEHESESKKTRASGSFIWNEECFYCGKACMDDDGRSSTRCSSTAGTVRTATSVSFRDNLMQTCETRNDTWACDVKGTGGGTRSNFEIFLVWIYVVALLI